MSEIAYEHVRTPLGKWLVAGSPRGVCLVCLRPQKAMVQLRDWLRRNEPAARVEQGGGILQEAVEQLEAYAAGQLERFELPLDLRGTDFQKRVWKVEQRIPYGATWTYSQVAQKVGNPKAVRAVGSATGKNPTSILVPCHRVVARNGLGGFGAGLPNKRKLLQLEGSPLFASA